MITDNTSGPAVIAQATNELSALQAAFAAVKQTQAWLSGLAVTDLTATAPLGLGLSTAYATALKSAYADADAVRVLYETGKPPSSYPQPPTAYVYAQSQPPVIGP